MIMRRPIFPSESRRFYTNWAEQARMRSGESLSAYPSLLMIDGAYHVGEDKV